MILLLFATVGSSPPPTPTGTVNLTVEAVDINLIVEAIE